MIYSFEPIAYSGCRILLLGSMPGAQSLRRNEYYGNKQNAFWRIMFSLLNNGEAIEDYDLKLKLLLDNSIAAWDVLRSCTRVSSSDSDIRDPGINDFQGFFSRYPGIHTVFFNGQGAEGLFRKLAPRSGLAFALNSGQDSILTVKAFPDITFLRLPSTSPANTMRFEDKLAAWRLILQFIQ